MSQPSISQSTELTLNNIIEYINVRKNQVLKVLDIGCGIKSKICTGLRESGHEIILHGLDIDPYAMKNKVVDKVYISSAENMPFDDSTYDVVVSNYLLEHVDDYRKTLNEMARVVEKGGLLSLTFANPTSPNGIIARLTPLWFHKFFRTVVMGIKIPAFPTVYSYKSVTDVVKCLDMNGFTKIKTTYISDDASFWRKPIPLRLAMVYIKFLSAFGLDRLKSSVVIISQK